MEIRVDERTKELRILNNQLSHELKERTKTETALRESEQQLRVLSSRLLSTQETERSRISRELHDELGHSLIMMKLALGQLETASNGNPAAVGSGLEALGLLIDKTIEDLRRLSRDLSPSVLENLGLTAAIRWLVKNHSLNDGVEVTSSIINLDQMFSRDQQVVLYRIIQEALTNITKHAAATHVSVVTAQNGNSLVCVIEDDGKGFDLKETLAKARSFGQQGFGLSIIVERARMLGGSITISSKTDEGTQLTLSVPLENRSQVTEFDSLQSKGA